MKNILFMLLAFLCLPSWGADEPKKKPTKIELDGRLESNDERALILPLEAFENDTEVNLTCWQTINNATITITGINGTMFCQVISLGEGCTETISLNGYAPGTYTLVISTPQGTYLSGMFVIE